MFKRFLTKEIVGFIKRLEPFEPPKPLELFNI